MVSDAVTIWIITSNVLVSISVIIIIVINILVIDGILNSL